MEPAGNCGLSGFGSWKNDGMRKINNRQNKFRQIKPKPAFSKTRIKDKRGRRRDSKLDRRGMK